MKVSLPVLLPVLLPLPLGFAARPWSFPCPGPNRCLSPRTFSCPCSCCNQPRCSSPCHEPRTCPCPRSSPCQRNFLCPFSCRCSCPCPYFLLYTHGLFVPALASVPAPAAASAPALAPVVAQDPAPILVQDPGPAAAQDPTPVAAPAPALAQASTIWRTFMMVHALPLPWMPASKLCVCRF